MYLDPDDGSWKLQCNVISGSCYVRKASVAGDWG